MKKRHGRLRLYLGVGLSLLVLWGCEQKVSETPKKQELASLKESEKEEMTNKESKKEAKTPKEKIEKENTVKKSKKTEETVKEKKETETAKETQEKAKKPSVQKESSPSKKKDKVEYKVSRDRENLSFKTHYVETASLPRGTEKISKEGKEGYRVIEHKDKYINGEKVGRTSSTVEDVSPIDRIIEVGTGVESGWDDSLAFSVFDQLNRYRVKNGLNVLEWDEKIAKMAKIRAKEIVILYDHFRPNGMYYDSLFDEMGYDFCRSGENISNIYTTVEDVMNAWSISGSHNQNMLDEFATSAGMGVYRDVDGTVYWVQIIVDKC